MSVMLKTTKSASVSSVCLHFVTQHANFLGDVYFFVTGVTKATVQGRSESQLPEWLGSKFHRMVLG